MQLAKSDLEALPAKYNDLEVAGTIAGKAADTEKHETEDMHEFLILKQDLDSQKVTANSVRDMKAQLTAEALQSGAAKNKDLIMAFTILQYIF